MDTVFMVKYSDERPSLVNTVVNLLGDGKEKSLAFVVCLKTPWLSSL
jgi:hypothetical protein